MLYLNDMYKITANSTYTYQISLNRNGFTVDDKPVNPDIQVIDKNTCHIILNNKSFLTEVIELNSIEKKCIIKVNDNVYQLVIQDRFDELLHQLGMDTADTQKINDVKAPMPGLVLNILVKEGDTVQKGDNLLVLEAMKMENIIKSPADVVVKSIHVKPGDKVEKNQVLANFV